MANSFLKATRIAAAALGLLQREIVLPSLVWRDAGGDFAQAFGDTISIRVPARTNARSRTLRTDRPTTSEGAGIIQMDELTETKVDVTLDEDIYNAVAVTDENLTLDILNFGQQILTPQVRAVAEGLENKLAAQMTGSPTATSLTLDTADPYKTLVDARVAMNKANVPMSERTCVVGADLEGVFLKSDHIAQAQQSGSDSALRDAIIGRVAGFGNIYVSNALPPDVGYCFHRTAYVLSLRAPAIPDGASYGNSQAFSGLAMRWLRDYDFRNVQDRSLIDVYAGTNIIADGQTNEVQTVTITGAPTGGTFTLTYSGQTTANISYSASSGQVQAALASLSTIGRGNVSVSGNGPYRVTFQGTLAATDVAAMTASGTGLTGGTTPGVTVTTPVTGSATKSFVRAVKISL